MLVLLIVSVAVHFALTGLALVFFGAEGWRTPAFVSGQVDLGFMTWSAQSLFVVATCAILIVGLWLFFGKTLYGARAPPPSTVAARAWWASAPPCRAA